MLDLDHIMRWRCSLADWLFVRKWEGENCIVFNAVSGQSHFLNDLAMSVLDLLKKDTLGFDELQLRLTQIYDLEQAFDLQIQIRSVISDLDSVGLIGPDFS